VANTCRGLPFCMTINWLVVAFIVVEIAVGLQFR
jgi:hypothetical protein